MSAPRLAETEEQLWREVTRLTKSGIGTDLGILYPLVCVLGVGEFRIDQRIKVVEFCGAGTVREPTAREMAELEYAMAHDTAQVILKTHWGGLWKACFADREPEYVRALHQPRGLGWKEADYDVQQQTACDLQDSATVRDPSAHRDTQGHAQGDHDGRHAATWGRAVDIRAQ